MYLQLRLDVWASCTCIRSHIFYNNKEHCSSIILGVESVFRLEYAFNYQMIFWIHLLSFWSLLLELGPDHPWDPWWTIYLRWVSCYTSSGPWTSPALLWNPCNTIHSSWSPCSPWIVVMMRWSRWWTSASQFLNEFPQQWISHSSIPQSVHLI